MAEEIVENADPNTEVDSTSEPKRMSYEELEAELRRVRHEAAGKRVALREMEDKAKRWENYEESQKTELQKLQEALADREKKLSGFAFEETKRGILKEYELEDDDLILLTGSDEDTVRKQAENIKAKNEKSKTTSSSRPADLLAGNRGAPVGSANTTSFDDVLRAMARGR